MPESQDVPREEGLDHSVSLMREGYMYILNRRKSFQSNVFETRLLGQKAICMGGKNAAELFYDQEKFKRKGAAPKRVQETLFGKQGVQTLDDNQHLNRKEMFMSLMSEENTKKFIDIHRTDWKKAVEEWTGKDEIVFYEEAKKILCQTACKWAGVPLPDEELEKRTNELASLFETPALIGPEHWKGRHNRNILEAWMKELVEKVREGEWSPDPQTALYTMSWHKDVEGERLDPHTAAVEILNILRPITAIAIYMCFTVLALEQFPEEKGKLASEPTGQYLQWFVQEIRRFYPFFPFVTARVKKDFTWSNYDFEKDTLTLLDVYGTNHDPELWDNPELFHPERFKVEENSQKYQLIPQGGGSYVEGHRCPGEGITIEAMKVCADFLLNKITYQMPEQDLSYSLVSMPSKPKSGCKFTQIHWKQ
ncbi:cytochrome P450 [Siminovitchia sediminis]|uniref:Cytochrome P450 n=1 Tax=Siminovitchia sediminis TaxID=1274353 RepID=A0ABW4KDN1_9BACI